MVCTSHCKLAICYGTLNLPVANMVETNRDLAHNIAIIPSEQLMNHIYLPPFSFQVNEICYPCVVVESSLGVRSLCAIVCIATYPSKFKFFLHSQLATIVPPLKALLQTK